MPGITNFYTKAKKFLTEGRNPHFEQTQMKINSRTLIVGSSGSGKTNAMLQYIALCKNTFHSIWIVTKQIEPLYEMLEEKMRKSGRVHILFDIAKLPNVSEIRDPEHKTDQTLVIFDDQVTDKKAMKGKIAEYFIRGRKQNVTMFFISQSYYEVPKLIRSQMQYLILLKISSARDLKLIFSDFSFGSDREAIVRIYREATASFPNFLKIDVDQQDLQRKFTRNFTEFFRICECGESEEEEESEDEDDQGSENEDK